MKRYRYLEQLRIEKGYTIKEMAKEVKISPAYYCQIELGTRRLYYDLAIRIAKVFNLKPDEVFYEETK